MIFYHFQVSVTLTLTTEAANNVHSVIAAVADLLKIAYPTTFDVHQTLNNTSNCTCSSTVNPNDFLSLTSSSSLPTTNRAASIYKLGRETSVSIQTMIDTQPKHCRNCSEKLTVETFLRKRWNELPTNLRELTPNTEPFIYFCHEQCFTTYSQATNPIEVTTPSPNKSMPVKRQDQVR